MYFVTRPPEPAYFRTRELIAERKQAARYFRRMFVNRSQHRYTFLWLDTPELMQHLFKAFRNKCVYCERLISAQIPGTFNRFRPKGDALNQTGAASPDHYWWLAYEWENIYLSCVGCDMQKGKRFPIQGTRATRKGGAGALDAEKPLLIDPCNENPIPHLVFFEDGLVAPRDRSERGATTIDILGLNRAELVEARRARAKELRSALDEGRRMAPGARLANVPLRAIANRLRWSDEKPFALMHLQLLQTWLAHGDEGWLKDRLPDSDELIADRAMLTSQQRRQAIAYHKERLRERETYSLRDSLPDENYRTTTRLIQRIKIQNFRGIDDIEIDLANPPKARAPWLMLLGENSTGKSSVLQAVALALIDDRDRRSLRLDARRYLKDKKKSGFVEVQLSDTAIQRIDLQSNRRTFKGSPEAMVLVLAYGSTRLLPRSGATAKRGRLLPSVRVQNLFDPTFPLIDANRSLGTLKRKSFDEVALALKRILDLPETGTIRKKGDQIVVSLHGRQSTLDELSDGYQSVIALATEIITVLRSQWQGALEQGEGILLVDELDTHLHPRWKMRIVDAIRRAFPRLQVIATTHDPLCLRGLHDGEVVVLQRMKTRRHRIVMVDDLPRISGLRVDQILLSEHFGLHTTMDPTIEDEFREYSELLSRKTVSGREKKRREELRARLAPLEVLGSSQRERLLLDSVDRRIAKLRSQSTPESREHARVATRGVLGKLWKAAGK